MPELDTRRRLLAATLTIVASDGVRAVTHRRVAQQAGVSLGTTTYHFGSRDEMLHAAYAVYLADLSDELARLWPAHVQDVDALVEVLVELLRREFAAGPQLVLVEYELYLAAAREPALARQLVAWERAVTAELVAAMEHLGALRPVEAARTILNVVRGIELERLTRDLGDDDIRRRIHPVLCSICNTANAELTGGPR